MGAANYVVYRSVDGGPIYWRGGVAGLSSVDSTRSGQLQYYVAARAANGTVSAQTVCTNGRPFVADVVAVGDMATCGTDEAPAVSALLDTLPGTILPVGDCASQDGTRAEYDNCFHPKFGRHRSRMVTAVGGTGGVSLRKPVAGELLPTSAFRSTSHHGVLALSLDPDRYQWRFLSTVGAVIDRGGDPCVN